MATASLIGTPSVSTYTANLPPGTYNTILYSAPANTIGTLIVSNLAGVVMTIETTAGVGVLTQASIGVVNGGTFTLTNPNPARLVNQAYDSGANPAGGAQFYLLPGDVIRIAGNAGAGAYYHFHIYNLAGS